MEDQPVLNKAAYSKILKERANKLKSELEAPIGQNELDPFLETVAGVESNFGENTEHKTIDTGIHKGSAAMGKYGIMPNTVRDAAKKVNSLDTQLGRHLQQVEMPKLRELASLNENQIKETLSKNPDLEQKVARVLALEAKLKQRGDEDRMSYNWNKGNNITFDSVNDETVQKAAYVQKFKKIRKRLGR
jgi:hypothetical protein